eukprot:194534_1
MSKEALELAKSCSKALNNSQNAKLVKTIEDMALGEYKMHHKSIVNRFKDQPEIALRSDPLVHQTFQQFDKDQTGYISKENLKSVLEKIGLPVNDEEAGKIIDDYARNPKRGISIDEFVSMMTIGMKG